MQSGAPQIHECRDCAARNSQAASYSESSDYQLTSTGWCCRDMTEKMLRGESLGEQPSQVLKLIAAPDAVRYPSPLMIMVLTSQDSPSFRAAP